MSKRNGSPYYVLDDEGNPVVENDHMRWVEWFATHDRTVCFQKIGDINVSTVFLGIDHNYYGGEAILFETMIFGGRHDQYQERYATKEEAMKGHEVAVALVRASYWCYLRRISRFMVVFRKILQSE